MSVVRRTVIFIHFSKASDLMAKTPIHFLGYSWPDIETNEEILIIIIIMIITIITMMIIITIRIIYKVLHTMFL